MADYIQLQFTDISPEKSEMVVARLSDIGFTGFEEEENSLKAFIDISAYNESIVIAISSQLSVVYSKSVIDETNWNAVWESNFQPVIIDDFAGIRARFHQPFFQVKHEIVITPKMSFGTGHHATTFMMIQQMREIDFAGKTVLDFGTGTGILAILAEQLTAKKIIAVDNDDWSIENAAENLIQNNCRRVDLRKGDIVPTDEYYDVILANINKNVILDNFSSLFEQLSKKGIIVLSGLLQGDEEDILSAVRKFSLRVSKKTEYNNWISLRFSH